MSLRKCIYVVDDEQVIAKTICLILERAHYSTSMFMDAESALHRIKESAPDLILSDVILNGPMTGIDLAEKVAYEHPNIPVMLMSGQAHTSELLDAALARGFRFKVHAKPIAPGQLLLEIASLLSSPAAPEGAVAKSATAQIGVQSQAVSAT